VEPTIRIADTMAGKQTEGVAWSWRERSMAHLLLIDDDPGLLPEKVRHLSPPAHRVEIAYTGSEGLECITAAPPDVILLCA
jgi:CheY-like chemotaxis protein